MNTLSKAPAQGTRTNESYDALALEYYDSRRHPTCRNFTEASREFVAKHIPLQCPWVSVDVGAGRSILCEVLFSRGGHDTESCVLLDSSQCMLSYSEEYALRGAKLVVATATNIPLRDASAGLIVASLGDPYNTVDFWREVARCLFPGGLCIFTTPSYEWTKGFRKESPNEREASAYFELRDGRAVYVPSYIYPVVSQIKLIDSAGLSVELVEAISTASLSSPLSPKLRTLSGVVESPVTGYRVARRQRNTG